MSATGYAKADLELQRLGLEVKKLELEVDGESKNGWLQILYRNLPGITTLLAVAGLIFSVYQYASARQLEREKHTQERIREDVADLLKYPSDSTKGVAWATNVFKDLDALTKDRPNDREAVTEIVKQIVVYDYERPNLTAKDVRLDTVANDEWPGYLTWLAQHPTLNQRIMKRYLAKYQDKSSDKLLREALRNSLYRHARRLKESDPVSKCTETESDKAKAPEFQAFIDTVYKAID